MRKPAYSVVLKSAGTADFYLGRGKVIVVLHVGLAGAPEAATEVLQERLAAFSSVPLTSQLVWVCGETQIVFTSYEFMTGYRDYDTVPVDLEHLIGE